MRWSIGREHEGPSHVPMNSACETPDFCTKHCTQNKGAFAAVGFTCFDTQILRT